MVECMAFDIGGVIAADVWEFMLTDKEEGIPSVCNLHEADAMKIGAELWEEFAYRQAQAPGADWRALEEAYWHRFRDRLSLPAGPAEPFIQMTDSFIRPVEGMIPLLARLHATGLPLAICSNNNEFFYRRQRDKLGLQRFFPDHRVVLSCHVGCSKSSPGFEMFHKVISAVGCPASSCLFVDDRAGNIQRALELGMTSTLFPSHAAYGARYLEALLKRMGIAIPADPC